MRSDFDEFFAAYLKCALWSSTEDSDDSGGSPLDENYDADDIAPASVEAMRREASEFFEAEASDLAAYAEARSWGDAGHDFWLTRNGHGAGFWDRGLGELGERLSKACKPYGSCDLYVGDDGKVYHA